MVSVCLVYKVCRVWLSGVRCLFILVLKNSVGLIVNISYRV